MFSLCIEFLLVFLKSQRLETCSTVFWVVPGVKFTVKLIRRLYKFFLLISGFVSFMMLLLGVVFFSVLGAE